MSMSQKQRVLHALQQAGDQGVDQTMFLAPGVCDGGPPITRVAARIKELRDGGFAISEAGWRRSCRVYVLAVSVVEPVPAESDGALFDASVGTSPRSAYEVERDAA